MVAAGWAALAGCGGITRAPQAGEGLWRHVRPDTVAVVGLRMDRLRATTMFRQYLAAPGAIRELDTLKKETGFDPRYDLDEALLAWDGTKSVLLGSGNFAVESLASRFLSTGGKRLPYQEHMLLGDEEFAACFLDRKTLLAGPAPVVRSVLDFRGRGNPAALRSRAEAMPRHAHAWLVATGPLPKLPLEERDSTGPLNATNLNRLLQPVRVLTATLDVTRVAELRLQAECPAEDEARRLHDTLQGLLALGRLLDSHAETPWRALLEPVSVRLRGAVVEVAADVPESALDPVWKSLR